MAGVVSALLESLAKYIVVDYFVSGGVRNLMGDDVCGYLY